MISLVDEKYVDEIFEDRLSGKRKNIFVTFTAAAAALAAAVVGIGYFVSTAGSDGIEIPEPAVIIADVTDADVTDITKIAVPIDCEEIFKNKGGEFPISFYCHWDNEFGNDSQIAFGADYVRSVIPFSAEGYSDSRSQFYVYCDGSNEPYGAGLYFESEFDETASPKFRSINVYSCAKGKLDHTFPLEDATSVNCFGVDIYGFDDTANYYEGAYDKNLKAYFVLGDTEYAVETSNLSCEETVKIIEDIIKNGFSFTDLDLSEGKDFDHEATSVSLEEANTIEPFAGHVPQVSGALYPYSKGAYYDVVKFNGEVYCQTLTFSYTDGTDSEDGKRINFAYYTKSTGRGEKTFETNVSPEELSLEKLNDLDAGGEYKFTIVFNGFFINVTSKCTADELWTYIENIADDTFSTEKNTITLAEAADTPFAEFVPKTEKIGDLSVGNIYLEKDGNNMTLTMDYSSQGRVGTFSYYGLVYHTDSQRVLENVVPIDSITKEYIEQLAAEPSSGAGNIRRFELSIECGGIWINIYGDCTSDELWEYVSAVKGNAPYSTVTLAEANKNTPFAEYVPQIESIGDMKLYGGGARLLDNGALGQSLIVDYREEAAAVPAEISVNYSQVTELQINSMAIVPFEELLFEDPANLKLITDGVIQDVRNTDRGYYRFVVDCGDFLITVNADCTSDEMQTYIMSLVSNNEFGNLIKAEIERKHAEEEERKRRQEEALEAVLTVEKLKELAKKGGELMWDDFDGYYFEDIGSGLCIRSYEVDGGYKLLIGGGSLNEKPMYINLIGKDEKTVDIRYESIDGILN